MGGSIGLGGAHYFPVHSSTLHHTHGDLAPCLVNIDLIPGPVQHTSFHEFTEFGATQLYHTKLCHSFSSAIQLSHSFYLLPCFVALARHVPVQVPHLSSLVNAVRVASYVMVAWASLTTVLLAFKPGVDGDVEDEVRRGASLRRGGLV